MSNTKEKLHCDRENSIFISQFLSLIFFPKLTESKTQVLEIRQIPFSSKSTFPTGQHLLSAINVPCPWSPLSYSREI